MPRIRRILETALDCDDMRRTASFYRSLFGADPILDTERLVVFEATNECLKVRRDKGDRVVKFLIDVSHLRLSAWTTRSIV